MPQADLPGTRRAGLILALLAVTTGTGFAVRTASQSRPEARLQQELRRRVAAFPSRAGISVRHLDADRSAEVDADTASSERLIADVACTAYDFFLFRERPASQP